MAPRASASPSMTMAEAKEQYKTLLALYKELKEELEKIEKENKGLRKKIHEALDKEKMQQILEDIVTKHS